MTYREAGVDLEAADRHVASIASLVTATWGEGVVGGFGGFAAGVELPPGYRRPVLMLTTDGVGTKLEVARRAGRWEGVGFDLVAMCVDDLAAAGARPLGLVDYLAVGRLDPDRDREIVASVAAACSAAGCPLLGGETAEHPGVMEPDQVDLAGAALGVVERGRQPTGERIRPGDVVVGLPSPNLRSNGFSLVRRVFAGIDLDADWGDGRSVGEVLLEPSVVYAPAVLDVLEQVEVHGAAHVTGGGLPGNLARPFPEGCRAVVDSAAWEVPEVFRRVEEAGSVPRAAMWEAFNMGVGFCLVVPPAAAEAAVSVLGRHGHAARVIGRVVAGSRGVEIA